MRNLESVIPQLIDNVKREILARPLFLGGVSGEDGGIGGPPGGFIGQLPQTRVAFDTTEAEDNTVLESGNSLLTNLNRIRYRIKSNENSILDIHSDISNINTDIDNLDTRITYIEDNGIGGIESISFNGEVIGSGIRNIDFSGDVVVTVAGDNAYVYSPEFTQEIYSGLTSDNIELQREIYKLAGVYKNGIMLLPGDDVTYSGSTVLLDVDYTDTDVFIINYFAMKDTAVGYGTSPYGTNPYGL